MSVREKSARATFLRLLVATLLATPLTSCALDRLSDGQLPNAAYSTIAFANEGATVYATTASEDGTRFELYAYDLNTNAIKWRHSLDGLAAVKSGTNGGLIVAEQIGRDAHVSLYTAGRGERSYRVELSGADLVPGRAPQLAARNVAASVRNNWLVVAPPIGVTHFYSLDRGQVPVSTRPYAGVVRQVEAHPERASVAIYEVENAALHRISIFERSGDEWREHAVIKDAAWPRWTSQGLLFVSSAGLERIEGGARKLLVDKARIDTDRRFDFAPYHVTPNGARGIAGFRGSLTLFDAAGTGPARTLTVEPERRAPLIQTAGFAGKDTWAVLASGALVRIDSQGRLEERENFGSPTEVQKNFVLEGSREVAAYEAQLAARGGYLSLYRPGQSRVIRRLH